MTALDTNDPAYMRLEAVAILRNIGPDPDAAQHVTELRRAIHIHCIVEGCPETRRNAGMCRPHYDRLKKWARTNEAHRIRRAS